MYFTISSRLMRAKMTCILSGSQRLHSTLLRRSNLCPMESPNTSTYTAFFRPNIWLGSPRFLLKNSMIPAWVSSAAMILTATRFFALFFSSSSTLLVQLPRRTSFSKWRISLASFQSSTSLRHLRYFRRYRFHSRTRNSPRSSGSGMDHRSSSFWFGASTRSSSSNHWRQACSVRINPSRI